VNRSFTVIDCAQRSPEWLAARCGRLTSTSADVLFKAGKGREESVMRRDLRIRLALERMTGRSQEDDYMTDAMRRGVEREGDARLAYEAETGSLVNQCGFLAHTGHLAGTSLDGFRGDYDGVVELKVPKSATHIGYLKAESFPLDYLHQIRHHLWVSGAKWCDFVSFDDRLPSHLQLVIHRVTREQLDIPGYEKAALTFLAEVEQEMKALSALRTEAA
jgi:hypothetical protein